MDLIPLPALLLAGVLLGLACAAPVVAWARWRRGTPGRRAALSTGLFALVAAQLSLGLLLLDATWPLTGYPMYAPRIDPGATINVLLLSGTTAGAQEVQIAGSAMFSDPLDLQARALDALEDPARRAAMASAILDYYNATQADERERLVALRGAVERRSVDAGGVITRVVEPVFVYPEAAP